MYSYNFTYFMTTYFDKYPNLIESREEGFILADLEIRGMAKRTDQGIISIGADGMSYSDNENYKNNWSVLFSGKGGCLCQIQELIFYI